MTRLPPTPRPLLRTLGAAAARSLRHRPLAAILRSSIRSSPPPVGRPPWGLPVVVLLLSMICVAPTLGAAPDASPPAEPPLEVRAARAALAAGDHAKALDAYERAVRAAPDELRWSAEYRQAAIAAEAYERPIELFGRLAEERPRSAAVWLNLGYAFVDKIPAAGAVTQVILADKALGHFSRAIELDPSWLALYTRGNSYVYWPAIFGRTAKGIADLERAIEREPAGERRPFHSHAWIALGDAHWRLDDLETARETWRRGLERFPGNAALRERLRREGKALDELLGEHYAIGKRVDTSLEELWEG